MNYLVDTNCISELTKRSANYAVLHWFDTADTNSLFLSTITVAEIKKGIEKLPPSSRKDVLNEWLDHEMNTRFKYRVLPFGIKESLIWGTMVANLEQKGIVLPLHDSMIAAIALSNNLTLVTRNTKYFESTGVALLNPWDAQ